MSYFWYSNTGGREGWKHALSEQRGHIVSTLRPAFVTVLDAGAIPQDDWSREDFLKMKYSGPLYFDWDSDDITKSIRGFHTVLARLRDEYDVNLHCIHLYATGGRGFHVEIPIECFVSKVPRDGVQQLPYIYREIALTLAVDTLDLKVYSGRKGRMWRVPNVQRDNGRYKVPLTVDEALSIDSEARYNEITSEPRLGPARVEPQIAVGLQALFSEKRDVIDAMIRKQAKAKDERADLAKFKGDYPASLRLLMAGEHLRHDTGFNNIAMQFAIVSLALGKTAEQMVEACEGFLQNHSSDGDRYNSPRKRREALLERYHYLDGNPCYVFTFGGLRSICELGWSPADLGGLEDSEMANGYAPDNDSDEDLHEGLSEEVSAQIKLAAMRDNDGIMVHKTGVYRGSQDGMVRIGDIAFVKPVLLIDLATRHNIGFTADIWVVKGVDQVIKKGRQAIGSAIFNSRATLDAFCAGNQGYFRGTDVQATIVRTILTNTAIKNNKMIYTVAREGIDIVDDPDAGADEIKKLVIWASREGVVEARDLPDNDKEPAKISERLVYRPVLTKEAVYRPDVHKLTPIAYSDEAAEYISLLLRFSRNEQTVAASLGWFVSCFHRQLHHAVHGQFPILHYYGQAGSGKTTTPLLLSRMFWGKIDPPRFSASRSGMTDYARKANMAGSASLPMLIDEFKRQDIGEQQYGKLMTELRNVYNAETIASGGMSDGSADSSFRNVTQMSRSAPIVLMAETLIDETAFQERAVLVGMSQDDQDPLTWSQVTHHGRRQLLTHLGAALLWATLRETLDSRREAYEKARSEVVTRSRGHMNERPLVNLAVVFCGLEFLRQVLEARGFSVSERIEQLKVAMLDEKNMVVSAAPRAEAYKCLADISSITHAEDYDSEFAIREGLEYIYGDGYVEMKMRDVFIRYHSWAKRKGFSPYYSSPTSFIEGLARCSAVVDKFCLTSPLRTSPAVKVFRFSLSKLMAEEVEPFKSKNA